MSARRVHYEARLKRRVILYAKEKGNKAAERKFTISEANIRRWRKNEHLFFTCKATSKGFTGPKGGRHPEIEASCLQFVTDEQSRGLRVTRHMVHLKAMDAAHSLGINNFSASRGWCDRFLRRAGLSLEGRGSLCQKPAADSQDSGFQGDFIQLGRKEEEETRQISTADDTPAFYHGACHYAVSPRGSIIEVKVEK